MFAAVSAVLGTASRHPMLEVDVGYRVHLENRMGKLVIELIDRSMA